MSSNINTTIKTSRKRFSDEQIKSLETTFETESRPELRIKQLLANKLGLQPRQVAIWFQNKRARSKSKELELDYDILKSEYDKLASQSESLRKENQALLIQLQRLKQAEQTSDEQYENNNIKMEISEKPTSLLENNRTDPGAPLCNDFTGKVEYLWEEADVADLAQIADRYLVSTQTPYIQ